MSGGTWVRMKGRELPYALQVTSDRDAYVGLTGHELTEDCQGACWTQYTSLVIYLGAGPRSQRLGVLAHELEHVLSDWASHLEVCVETRAYLMGYLLPRLAKRLDLL